MITPSFKLRQNNEFLYIDIKTPFAKLNDLDVFIDENDFRFYCKPYFLRLNLPACILTNDDEINYDFEERMFKLKYSKKDIGEHFEGLDLLTKLLTPNCEPQKLATNLIEEINEEQVNNEDDDDDDEIQWYIEQKVNEDEDTDIKLIDSLPKYGFAQTKSNVFSRLNNEYCLAVDLEDPDHNKDNRTELRIENENSKFDDDHYLADFFDNDDMIESLILKYEPEYSQINDYTEDEVDALKNLPKKKFLLDCEQKFYAYSGLVDILFAYCYNERVNCGESNVECGWTIAKMSSTLSWLDTFKSLDQVVISSFRRSLCIPLYRNWKITQMVFKDMLNILKKGHKFILKCLLQIRKTFIDGDSRYILNDLYINDYCVWIQYASQKKINALVTCLEKINITKEMVNFDLDVLEMLANEQLMNPNDESFNETTSDSSSDSETSCKSDDNDSDNEIAKNLAMQLNLNSANTEKEKKLIEIL